MIYIYIYIPYWLFPIGYSLWAPVSHMYMYTNIMGRVCICIHVYIYIYIYAFGVLWAPSRRIWPWLNAFVLYMGPAFKQRVAREGRLPESQNGNGLLKK